MGFVGIDGEAIDKKYALIQDSEGGELLDFRGIKTKVAFEWLLERAVALKSIHPIFVGYVTTYDVNMILKDIDDETLKQIFSSDDKDFVKWEGYEILYIPRKVFKIRHKQTSRRVTLFDVFTFFGTSFVKACKGFLGEVPPEIVKGKADRVDFRRKQLEEIRLYNKAEVIWLVRLCDKLQEIFSSQGIELKKWHGPGAVAEYVLGTRGMNVHTEYPIYRKEEVPIGLWEAWDCAYFGGRTETMGIGSFKNAWSYDINSAYPHALSTLRTLDYGTNWKRKSGRSIRPQNYSSQSVYLVEWEIPSGVLFGPFPWRNSGGWLFYPRNGLGWYWQSEVLSAIRTFGSAIKIREVWYQEKGSPSIMQTSIPELFALRKRLQREGNPGEFALKIAMNSAYGKFAQRVGIAPFRCIPWAGQITSHTRAKLLDGCRGNEKDVISFATDAIYSRSKLNVPQGNNLGQWKPEFARKLLVIKNGFYRFDGEQRKSKTRGVPMVKVEEWDDLVSSLNARQEFTNKFSRFITHSLAIHFPNKYAKDRLKFVPDEITTAPFRNTRRIFDDYRLDNWEKEHTMSKPVKFPTRELSYPSSMQEPTVTLEVEEEDE